uniref:Reverse transcriptase domain-containing protein n=1 Tax=Lactuca sativa TaxID=4236 RepID=A0A9R1XC50_LACSA|nr:hypothetical protein LSAT_V11C500230760 [Lactuca sativa]
MPWLSGLSLVDIHLDGYSFNWSHSVAEVGAEELLGGVGLDVVDLAQKAKIRWVIKEDENTKYFHVYDSACYDFLDGILERIGFGVRWKRWIHGCLKSFIVLRQGDPLSPFLFIVVMEFTSLSQRLWIKESSLISHLFYVDDTIFISEWRDSKFSNIVGILQCFFLASDLKINIYKYRLLGLGVNFIEFESVDLFTSCAAIKGSFTYLGILVGGSMSKQNSWSEIPMGVQAKLESLRNRFLDVDKDDMKISWFSWENALASNENEGLGIFPTCSLGS